MANIPMKVYTNLAEIQQQKALVQEQIRKSEQQIGEMYRSMFAPEPENPERGFPSQKLKKAFSVGTSLVDGFLFGWKLYKRFKR